MFVPRPSRAARFARLAMRLALRFWPAESRDWGRALAAELDSIQSPIETNRWAFGGTLLFARALLSHLVAWLRLPAGARLNAGPLGPSADVPRCSRLVSGTLLVVAITILCLPQGRQALSAVKTSWGYPDSHGDIPALKAIGRQADREKDVRTLAFVALALSGSEMKCCPLRDSAEAIRYADRIVEIDPSFAWIYTGMRSVRGLGFRPDQADWLARLKASDPENAYPYLLSADAILEERYVALAQQHSPSELEVQASVENDTQWLGDIRRAILAQQFDTYSKNYFGLFRAFYQHNPSLDPSTYLSASYGSRFPDAFSMDIYVSIFVRRAKEVRSVEDWAAATEELERVARYGEQTSRRNEYDASEFGYQTAILALRGLKAALGQRGHVEKAAAVEDHLQRLKQGWNHGTSICQPRRRGFERMALLLHGLGFALVLFGSLYLASFVILEIPVPSQWRQRRSVRRSACLVADLCPALLVVTGAAFLYSYQPFVRAFKAQLSQSASLLDLSAVGETYMSLGSLPWKIRRVLDWLFMPFHQWMFATPLLALLALFILIRGLLRTRRSVGV